MIGAMARICPMVITPLMMLRSANCITMPTRHKSRLTAPPISPLRIAAAQMDGCFCMVRSLCLIGDGFAENARGSEDQDEDQDNECYCVLELGRRGDAQPIEEEVGPDGLEQAQDHGAQEGSHHVANPAENGSCKGLESRNEPHEEPGDREDQHVENAGCTGGSTA